jgi:hypothetical protein
MQCFTEQSFSTCVRCASQTIKTLVVMVLTIPESSRFRILSISSGLYGQPAANSEIPFQTTAVMRTNTLIVIYTLSTKDTEALMNQADGQGTSLLLRPRTTSLWRPRHQPFPEIGSSALKSRFNRHSRSNLYYGKGERIQTNSSGNLAPDFRHGDGMGYPPE